MHRFTPQGVCASSIDFEIENGRVKNLCFTDGCTGNLTAICKLVEGLPAEEVIQKLRNIDCQNGTSCADQLAIALEAALKEEAV